MTGLGLPIEKSFRWGYFRPSAMSQFNANLRRIQAARRIPNTRLAKAVGATPSMISKWRKNVTPEGKRIVELARALNVDVEELTTDAPRDLGDHTSTGVLTSDAEPFDRDITRGYVKNDVPVVGEAEASSN